MNTSLTAGALWQSLRKVIPTYAGGDSSLTASDGSFSNFLPFLNQYLEEVINSGTWEGTIMEVIFNGSTGYITLPYNMQSIVGVQINGWPQAVWGKFAEWQEVGPGRVRPDVQGIGPLIESPETSPTQRRIADFGTGGPLRIVLTNAADAGKTIRFYGKDLAGQEIFSGGASGIDFITAFPSGATSQQFSQLDNISVETDMISPWSLYSIQSAVDWPLSTYLPCENNPNYKRYLSGTWDVSRPIACLTRLKYNPIRFQTDLVNPGNSRAARYGLRAIFAEGANRDNDVGDPLWQRCYGILNQEHRARRGKAQYTVNFNPHGANNLAVFNSH
jgi:hypothetical protein